MIKRGLLSLAIATLAALPARAADNAVTIYSSARPGGIPAALYRPEPGEVLPAAGVPGYAVVRQRRELTLDAPTSDVRFTDVAARIDPTTVQFRSLTDPAGTHVLEQAYEFDLVSSDRLLQRFIDQRIEAEQIIGDGVRAIGGQLLSAAGDLVLGAEDGRVEVLREYSRLRFPALPGGLITRPTLVWQVATGRPGPHAVEVSYQTDGLTWWADYNLLLDDSDAACHLALTAWVSIVNRSGAGYDPVRVKLIAGDVQRFQPPPQPAMIQRMAMAEAGAADTGFSEKAFFEYHLYTLGRETRLPDNSTRQIELFPAADRVGCEQRYTYEGAKNIGNYGRPMTEREFGATGNKKVDVFVEFENRENNGLGMPLPAGRVRVNKRDPADDSVEFIGEDVIDHTPKNERVKLRLGSAFDVVGERRQTEFDYDKRAQVLTETIEVKLRNHKREPIEVEVRERLYRGAGWTITKASHQYEKRDATSIVLPVTVAPDAEAVVSYTVRYAW